MRAIAVLAPSFILFLQSGLALALALDAAQKDSRLLQRNTPDSSYPTSPYIPQDNKCEDEPATSATLSHHTIPTAEVVTSISLTTDTVLIQPSESTTTQISTAIVEAYSSDTTETLLSTTVLPAPSLQLTTWVTAPTYTPTSTTSTTTHPDPSTSTSSGVKAEETKKPEPTFFGILTYELGQHVIMYDVTANDTPYYSHAEDDQTATNLPVELLTNKSNVSKRTFKHYTPNKNGAWGPDVEGSKCTRKTVCTIEFQPDPDNRKNIPAFAVWKDEPYFKNIDTENKCHGSCKFEEC